METESQQKCIENSNFYVKESLNENSGLDSHISFAEQLLSKYDWDKTSKTKFLSQINSIKRKQRDRLLNLAVVGEFTTGKSTFINAMLRQDDFLVSSMLQGTTVAATIIEYSDDYAIVLTNIKGQQKIIKFNGLDALKEGIVSYTSDPIVAKNLSTVKIKVPATPLKSGFRIIDTPGTNSNEHWHEEITVRAINQLSDMAIIIVDANKPMSQSFSDFIKINLSDMLNRCVFVVTRIDMIRARERDMVLNYLKEKISVEFNLDEPLVFPYASIDVLDSVVTDEPSLLANQSFESESQMLLHMSKLKAIAQTQKLIALINSLFLAVSKKMSSLSNGYKDEHDYLVKTQHTDLRPFIVTQIKERAIEFQNEMQGKRYETIEFLENLSNIAFNNVIRKIDSYTTVDGLKNFAVNELAMFCYNEAQHIINQSMVKYDVAYIAFCDAMSKFQTEFKKVFKDLNILSINFPRNSYNIPRFVPIQYSDLDAASKYIAEQLTKGNTIMVGGAAAGATIGTAIVPGVGTIVGGVIGWLGGAAMTPKIDDVKKNTKDKLYMPLKSYFSNVVYNMVKGFDDYVLQIYNQHIPNEISKHFYAYQQVVETQIAQEKQNIDLVEKKLLEIQKDIDSISNHEATLRNLNERLSGLCTKEN